MATNTTNTFTNHTGNGTEVNFSISFTYISKTDIDVTVGGVLKTQGTHYTVNGQQITFTSGNTPANGAAIKIQRDTNISVKTVDFQDGSVLTEADLDSNTNQTLFAQQEITDKLAGIEEGATADQTAAEIRTLTESASDSNVFTDADHSKLNAIEAGATGDQTASEIRTLVESASDSNVFTDADHSKLNGIESGATADQTNAEIRAAVEAASDSNVFTDADHTKLNGIETGATADQSNAEIRAAVEAASDSNVFTDADHSKLNAIEANATQDQTASEIKTLYESNSDTNVLTDAEKTVINGVTANTTELNKLDGYTGSTADLNITSGMAKQTTITNSDSAFPTSGAVVDFVANQIAPVGGLEVIADEDSFPATQPVSGVVISIANIDGLIVNSSGVASNARTVGSGSDNVTINNFPASLRSKTMAAELGLLVSSTGASQVYNYHKLLAKEADVEQLSNDINDFAARYRVGSSNPTSDLDAGDLFYNTSTNKLLVYNATNSAWEETQSIGNFFISTLSPAFDGSTQNFTVTNAPANAQQILLSINGVVQKPNAGNSTPSEGFALDGNTIKLAAAPASGSDYHVVVLGSTVNIGTPSNNTVTSAMIVDGSIVNGDISPSAAIEGTKITPTINKPIQHLYTGNTITFTVTVASKDATHRYNGTGSGNGYKIDGKFAPYLKLIAGITYRFDQSDGSNSGHPLRFYLEANKTTAYTTNVTTNGTAGSSGAYTQILITDTTPATLHYQCSAHGYMGNSAETGGLVDLANLSASNLTSGTIPDARFPATLPTASAANLTSIPAGNLTGTVADARISTLTASKLTGALPAIDGSNLTGISSAGVNRNIVINGAMTVAQRGTSSTSSGYKTIDRFKMTAAGASATLTQEQINLQAGSPDPRSEGFYKAFRITNAGQNANSSGYVLIGHNIEAQNVVQSGWDFRSSSSNITLSFWVRSSVAQSFLVSIYANPVSGNSAKEYNFFIALSANTWTKITKTISGDSSITLNNDNGYGLNINWIPYLGGHYTSTGTVNQWVTHAGYTSRPDIADTWWTTSNSTFEMTGVQLEAGSSATSFAHEDVDTTKQRCKRYFHVLAHANYVFLGLGMQYYSASIFVDAGPIDMRTTPTFIAKQGVSGAYTYEKLFGNSAQYIHSIALDGKTTRERCILNINGDASRAGQAVRISAHFHTLSNNEPHVALDAELN